MSLRLKIILSIAASVALSAALILVPMLFSAKGLIEEGTHRELDMVKLRFETALEDRFHNATAMATLIAEMPDVPWPGATAPRSTRETRACRRLSDSGFPDWP
ncbi:hypothetical protein SAMN05444722_0724 [Rhodovulum sp. ES.010]|uniref:hypothetical protein n=1 Tax=Rhodovulum sp. ES.010 TaxID=1882821 RepID=UPI00092723BB|nr:hypothetical protein [Rhodovulum sp. ES.010]SIO18035.1 hypothetical protein SAMN05444722_0724 [Rhodovulum sp. ES.010]